MCCWRCMMHAAPLLYVVVQQLSIAPYAFETPSLSSPDVRYQKSVLLRRLHLLLLPDDPALYCLIARGKCQQQCHVVAIIVPSSILCVIADMLTPNTDASLDAPARQLRQNVHVRTSEAAMKAMKAPQQTQSSVFATYGFQKTR
jgi:hypothetical protein